MLRYQVSDMSCGHCVQSITTAIRDAEPDAQVQVDLAGKTVQVDGARAPAAVEAAIRQAGYTPQATAPARQDNPAAGGCCGHC